jgi:phosphoribosylamine-glycine ligase
VKVVHAGTRRTDDGLVTSGGRVLAITGVGADLAEARERAYAGVERIRIDGAHHRRDIALAAGSPLDARPARSSVHVETAASRPPQPPGES